EPTASSTASDTKFSEAISSRLRCWRWASARRALAISGSVSASRCISRLPFSHIVEGDDLLQPAGMTAAGELGAEPDLEDLNRGLARGDPCPERQDVGVVVLAAHPRRVSVAARGGAHARYLVGRHGHPDAGPADEDPAVGFSHSDGGADAEREVWIVHGVGRLRPPAHEILAGREQPGLP